MNRQSVKSSNIASIGYDVDTQTLEVEFLSNYRYQYFDVPKNHFNGIMESDSKGRYLAQNIKGVYRYTRL